MRHVYQDKLESARLVTRMLTENDIPIWADFFADKEAVEFFPAFVLSSNLESARHWVDKQLKRYADNRFGLQALIDRKSNDFVGQCGLIRQEVDDKEEVEVGYHIFKKYWGQGFAPEAARLFIDYAFQHDLTASVISIIDRKNIKSQRVAEKNGLAMEKETKWSGLDVYIYRINKHDYENMGYPDRKRF
ncbi:MAG: GNAT family N-acetyltransferase [Cyclobacteriaceae bacterium]|nr:GNAT family N-acetyltransferase [Cyclobacteriaceae bacterium]